MNNTSANIIKRQLMIIQFLLESNYVSTEDIQHYLKQHGFEVQIRSIQRDLTILEDIIPLECKKDDKPYSWRWQRVADTSIHGLSISQALALRLVETELKGVIPNELYESLTPLFVKARYINGLAKITNQEIENIDKLKTSGFVQMPLSTRLILRLKALSQRTSKQDNKSQIDELQQNEKQLIKKLVDELNHRKLHSLSDFLESH